MSSKNLMGLFWIMVFALSSFSVFAQEICDDGIDNDGDGLIDCYDPDCYASGHCDFYPADYCRSILPDSKEFGMQIDNNFVRGNYQVQGSGPSYNYAPFGYAIPKVADIDNDGTMEIVTVSSDGGTDGIFIFDPIKDQLKYFIPLTLADKHTGVTLANVDTDPYVEIIIATGYESTGNNRIYRYDFNGTSWNQYTNGSWPIVNAYTRRGFQPDIVDFNEDGTPELLFYGEQGGNKKAAIYNIEDGTIIIDLIAKTGGSSGHLASHMYWKDHFAFADVIPEGFDPGTGPLQYAKGVELITGTRVYTIDIETGNIEDVWGADPSGVHKPWVNGSGNDGDAGQKVAYADINMDGNVDIVVTGQGRISIWDPLTNASICNTQMLGGGSKGGIVCIGDVDGDAQNQPEIGVVSKEYVEVFRYNTSHQLEQVWGLANSDDSGETACNFFDFEGDGSVEMVYRDKTDLWVYEGEGDGAGNPRVLLTSNQTYNDANGLITNVDACSSDTGSEHPIIVDVDQNNRADIVVACSEGLRVYRDRLTPWISSRGIFNQRSYNYVNINDDMTVPAVMQKNHVVPNMNNYLTQMYRIDQAGNPFYPAPDFTIEVKSIDNLCHGTNNDEVDFMLNIFNYGDGHADDFEVPITFYDGDPSQPGAKILKQEIVNVNLFPLNTKETHVFNIKMSDLDGEGDGFDTNIYITINDNVKAATAADANGYLYAPVELPNSPYPECNYANNTIGPFIIRDCVLKAPLVSLDNNQSSHGGTLHYTDFLANYTEDAGKVSISDSDVKITDDGTNLSSAIIEIYNPLDGEAYEGLYWNETALAAYGISTPSSQGDTKVYLYGDRSISDYESAIELFQYQNTSNFAHPDDRLIIVRVVDSNDGLQSGSAICHFGITTVNDAPTSEDYTITANENEYLTFTGKEFSFDDVDGDKISNVLIQTLPAKGRLFMDSNLDGVYSSGEAFSANQVFTINEIYAGLLKYIPATNESGELTSDYSYASFDFKVSDGSNYSDAANEITIRVLPDNYKPTASSNSLTINEDAQAVFAVNDFNFSDLNADDELYKVLLVSTPGAGTLFVDANDNDEVDETEALSPYDEVFASDITNGLLKYQPVADKYGSPYASFSFRVNDAVDYSAEYYQMTINVLSQEDKPVAVADEISVNEGGTTSVLSDNEVSVLNNDTDADGDVITATLDTDVTNGTLIFSNDGTFTYTHNGSETTYDSFKYKVHDGKAYGNTVLVSIYITAVNDNSPVIVGKNATVDENFTGTVLTATATDADSNDSKSFSLSGDDASSFNINSSGALTFKAAPNYESPSDKDGDNVYDISITVTDGAGNKGVADFHVTVTDTYEESNFTLKTIDNVSVSENVAYTSEKSEVATGTPIGSLSYSLGGDDAAKFTITPSTGVVKLTAQNYEAPADKDKNNVYELNIIATDSDGNSASTSWTVTITDEKELSSFTLKTIENVNVAENVAYTSVTPEVATGTPIGSVTYSLGGNDASKFSITQSTGVVKLAAQDYENPKDANTNNVYEVSITATDSDGNEATTSWTVTITDEKELSSFTLKTIENVNVAENVAYTSVTPEIATGTPIGSVTYSLGGNDAGKFSITPSTGVVKLAAQDYENPKDANTNNVYEVSITATDSDGNEATTSWTVTITDEKELSSFTLKTIENVNFAENVAYTSVTPEVATGTPIGSLTYSLGGNDAGKFSITPSTGVVKLVAQDYENPKDDNTNNVYEVSITATDSDGNEATTSWTVTIENQPETATFTIKDIEDVSVDEGSTYTSVQPEIDGAYIGSISYAISGNDSDLFSINESTGVVSMVARDYEKPEDADALNTYDITITATDDDGNKAYASWVVNIADVKELSTFTLKDIEDVSIDENSAYTSVTPSIETGTPIGAVSYSLAGADADAFTINSLTGVVSMVGRNYENPADDNTDNVYQVSIVATDADDNTASVSWTVQVEDIIEKTSFTLTPIDNVSIEENNSYTSVTPSIATGSPIGGVTYRLGGTDANDFSIDAETGVVSMTVRNYEKPSDDDSNNVYELSIIATDYDGNTATESWTVTVTDIVEVAHFALKPIDNVSIEENKAYTSVIPLLATGTPIGALTYELGGTDAGEFSINTTTGVVTMVAHNYESPEDIDTGNTYELSITATDADGNTASESWVVSVTDVTEISVFTLTPISNATVNENTAYTSVTPSIASGTPIDGVTYTIGGNDADMFTINATTGVVKLAAQDYENPVDTDKNNVYEVSITATDDEENTASVSWSVQIVNVHESVPAAADDTDETDENQSVVIDVLDNDSGLDDGGLVLTITDAPENAEVTVNSDNTITLTPASDYYGNITFSYQVCDIDNQCSSADVTVTVNEVFTNNAPVATDDAYEVNKNEALKATSLLTNDTDADNDALTIQTVAVTEPQHGTVTINADGTFIYQPDANYVGSDSFTYEVCDNGTPQYCAQAEVTLTIIDNDYDNDGIINEDEGDVDSDNDGITNPYDTDSDNDGILDEEEGIDDVDNDGIPNFIDEDSDNDNIPDSEEGNIDSDNDGKPNYIDEDSDNDGISDLEEGTGDIDNDGIPNYIDEDSDGDGISDAEEGTIDSDNDGIPNYMDTDSDNDGIPDAEEGTDDPDNDGIPNYIDEDSDDDGISDLDEGISDNDNDGIPNYFDEDSDGDGIADAEEGDVDSDEDGTPDYLDQDSDDDGISDSDEGTNDPDGDGLPNYLDEDSDDDGISDTEEGNVDSDGDGLSDYVDIDSDDDGVLDKDESKGDCDNDGIPNRLDTDFCYSEDDLPLYEGFSPNNDGDNDYYVIPWLNQFQDVSIEIFNRWGNVVFKQSHYENNWNGESNVGFTIGEELPAGTYYYIINVKDLKKKMTGYIYINR